MKRIFLNLIVIAGLVVSSIPPAYAADTQAPILVDWKLLDEKADISASEATIGVEFSISDDSEIEGWVILTLNSNSSTQQTGLLFSKLISKVGKISTYQAFATIGLGKAPGEWSWTLYPLKDVLGNSSNFGPGGNWPVTILVYDKDFTEAQQLADAKAKQDAAIKAAQETIAANLKAKQDADAKAAADLKAAVDKAKADAAKIPVGDVGCSLVDDGVRYGVSMTFGSASVTLGSLTYDWDYSLLGPTGNPALVSSYSARQFFKSTDVNGMNLTYKELLILAAGNIKATILIFVSPVNSVGNLVTRNALGKGCYVELPTVFKNIEKATADKAAAELKAKQEAEAKAAAEKLAVDKALSDAKSALAKSQSDLRDANSAKAAAEAAAKQAVSDKETVEANGKAALAQLQTQLSSLNAKMAEMQLQIDSVTAKFTASQKSLATVNAKLKKICAVKPKPKGC